jgi:hypothetical protein
MYCTIYIVNNNIVKLYIYYGVAVYYPGISCFAFGTYGLCILSGLIISRNKSLSSVTNTELIQTTPSAYLLAENVRRLMADRKRRLAKTLFWKEHDRCGYN